MSKGLEALQDIRLRIFIESEVQSKKVIKDLKTIEKELKALEVISQNFRLVGNCLHATNKYDESGWVFVKEIENEEELKAWEEMLLCQKRN